MKKYLVNFNANSIGTRKYTKTVVKIDGKEKVFSHPEMIGRRIARERYENSLSIKDVKSLGYMPLAMLDEKSLLRLTEAAMITAYKHERSGFRRDRKTGKIYFVDVNVNFVDDCYKKEYDDLRQETWRLCYEYAERHPERDAWSGLYYGAFLAWRRIKSFVLGKQTRKNGKTVGYKTTDSLDQNMENGIDYALPRRFENATVTRIDLARACKDGIDLYILDCLESGYTQAYIANTLHKSQQAISKRIKALRERLNTFTGFLYIMEA